MWVRPARHADFDFCYLGQSSLPCRGGAAPWWGEKGFNQRLHLFCKFARKAHLDLCGPSTSFHQSRAWPHRWLSHLLTADLAHELERWQLNPLKFSVFPSKTRCVRGCQLWPCLPFSFIGWHPSSVSGQETLKAQVFKICKDTPHELWGQRKASEIIGWHQDLESHVHSKTR